MDDCYRGASLLGSFIDAAKRFIVAGDEGLAEGIVGPFTWFPSCRGARFLQGLGEGVELLEIGDGPPVLGKRAEPLHGIVRDGDVAGVRLSLGLLRRDFDVARG